MSADVAHYLVVGHIYILLCVWSVYQNNTEDNSFGDKLFVVVYRAVSIINALQSWLVCWLAEAISISV